MIKIKEWFTAKVLNVIRNSIRYYDSNTCDLSCPFLKIGIDDVYFCHLFSKAAFTDVPVRNSSCKGFFKYTKELKGITNIKTEIAVSSPSQTHCSDFCYYYNKHDNYCTLFNSTIMEEQRLPICNELFTEDYI